MMQQSIKMRFYQLDRPHEVSVSFLNLQTVVFLAKLCHSPYFTSLPPWVSELT